MFFLVSLKNKCLVFIFLLKNSFRIFLINPSESSFFYLKQLSMIMWGIIISVLKRLI